MSRYLEILALQDPFPIGEDENDRVMFSCNYEGHCADFPVKLEEEIYRHLFDAGLATLNTSPTSGGDTVLGRRTPPNTTGSSVWTNIIRTSGGRPDETHNGDIYGFFSFQIITRSPSYVTARTRALAIRSRLHGTRNTTITAA